VLAVQLAKIYGAGTVIAAASSQAKLQTAIDLGADAGVNYSEPGWEDKVKELTDGRGVDVVIESVGGSILTEALSTLASFGRMVVLGSASNIAATVPSGELFNHNRSMVGFGVHQYFPKTDLIRQTVEDLVANVISGRLKLRLDHVLPLSQAAQAHRLVEERLSTGKVVLTPWDDPALDGPR
jgi:NADPH2:quinone reductase